MRRVFSLSVRRWWPLGVALLAALALRIALWGNLPRQGMVSDEAEYLASAIWLAQGRGFTWHAGWLWTRAPLYPLFLAVHLRVFGLTLTPIYLSQTVLGLLQVALVYGLAHYACSTTDDRRRTTDGRVPTANCQLARWRRFVPGLAALLVGLYFPLAVYNQVLLSETLYITLILAALLTLAYWSRLAQQHGWRGWGLLAFAGAILGLATLTRGLALGFVVVAAGWVVLTAGRELRTENRELRTAALRRYWHTSIGSWFPSINSGLALVLGSLFVILPWTFYATRQYGGLVVVDTTGAFNLLLGARTAYDGDRKDAPTRNFVLALLDPRMSQDERKLYLGQSCLALHNDAQINAALNRKSANISQAERQRLMTAEGLCLLRERPLAFAQKSLAELIDFFRINYGGDERFTDGFTTGRLSPAYTLGTFLLDDTLYVLALPLAVIGWTLARQETGDKETRRQGDKETENLVSRVSHLASRVSLSPCLPVSCLVALWWLYNLLTAPLLFAINRFRVPLMPLLLIYAAYGILALGAGGWRGLSRRQVPHLALAALLGFVVAVPASWISSYDPVARSYRAQESYFGPHPASIADTSIALGSRSRYWRTEALQVALGAGDHDRAGDLLSAGGLPISTTVLGQALLAGLAGDPNAGLALLPEQMVLTADDRSWQAQASVVRGDLLRRLGAIRKAKDAFTPRVVDDYNPVEWSWNWLHPSPPVDGRIDLGGNLDLGYIRGFYLGEGDRETRTTWRWSGAEAALRFPGAGIGASQMLHLRIDGASGQLPAPQFSVWFAGSEVATQPLTHDVRVYDVPLPASAVGADVVVTLRAPVFVPGAADLLAQQGPQVGQLRLLGLRLDWAELSQR